MGCDDACVKGAMRRVAGRPEAAGAGLHIAHVIEVHTRRLRAPAQHPAEEGSVIGPAVLGGPSELLLPPEAPRELHPEIEAGSTSGGRLHDGAAPLDRLVAAEEEPVPLR